MIPVVVLARHIRIEPFGSSALLQMLQMSCAHCHRKIASVLHILEL